MKSLLLASVGALGLTACLYSKPDELCIRSFECQGDADPAATCFLQNDDCAADDECRETRERCAETEEALAACLLENGSCGEVDDNGRGTFAPDATAEGGDCEDENAEHNVCVFDGG